jgi:hypothetical protein
MIVPVGTRRRGVSPTLVCVAREEHRRQTSWRWVRYLKTVNVRTTNNFESDGWTMYGCSCSISGSAVARVTAGSLQAALQQRQRRSGGRCGPLRVCGRCRRIRGSSMTYTSTNELPTSSKVYFFVSVQMTYLTKRTDISMNYRTNFTFGPPKCSWPPNVYDLLFLKRVVLTYHDVQV